MRAIFVVLLMLNLLAGCTRPNEPPATKPPESSASPSSSTTVIPEVDNGTVDLFGLHPALVDCLYFEIGFQAPRENLSRHLPPGYAPAGIGSPATGSVNLNAFSCASIIVTNETVIPSFQAAFTIAVVSVNETLRQNSSFHYYALEIFVSNETILKMLEAMGYHARLAEIQYTSSTDTVEFSVSVAGSRWYRAQGGKGVGATSDYTLDEFTHQVGANNTPQWVARNHVFRLPAFPSAGIIEVEAGALMSIQPANSGTVSATSREGPSQSQLTFGRLS